VDYNDLGSASPGGAVSRPPWSAIAASHFVCLFASRFVAPIILLAKLPGKLHYRAVKITEEMKRAVLMELAKRGGRARAQKYDKKTLSKWAKKGGRPRKDGTR
jgi:hypothetical protein